MEHLLRHRLNDLRGDQHVASVEGLAASHLGHVVGYGDEGRVSLVYTQLQVVQPQAAALRQVGSHGMPSGLEVAQPLVHLVGHAHRRIAAAAVVQAVGATGSGSGGAGVIIVLVVSRVWESLHQHAPPLGYAGCSARTGLDIYVAHPRHVPEQISRMGGTTEELALVIGSRHSSRIHVYVVNGAHHAVVPGCRGSIASRHRRSVGGALGGQQCAIICARASDARQDAGV